MLRRETCETDTSLQQLTALHEMTNVQTEAMIASTARAARLASIAVVTRPCMKNTLLVEHYRHLVALV